jgi:hypothetical protein
MAVILVLRLVGIGIVDTGELAWPGTGNVVTMAPCSSGPYRGCGHG